MSTGTLSSSSLLLLLAAAEAPRRWLSAAAISSSDKPSKLARAGSADCTSWPSLESSSMRFSRLPTKSSSSAGVRLDSVTGSKGLCQVRGAHEPAHEHRRLKAPDPQGCVIATHGCFAQRNEAMAGLENGKERGVDLHLAARVRSLRTGTDAASRREPTLAPSSRTASSATSRAACRPMTRRGRLHCACVDMAHAAHAHLRAGNYA